MPPMDALGGAMGSNPNMMDDTMGIGSESNMGENPQAIDDIEGGFDAGVEADPVEDPKKYIQQLSGKLSQELRKFNNNQEQPDEELNKYVAGMIIPQASKGLTDKGKKEIIGKIKQGVSDDENDENSNSEPQDNELEKQTEMPTESKGYRKKITEIINQILDDDSDKQKERHEKKVNKRIKTNNPFVSNR